jgi:putative aldouronate transport system permease protein
MQVITISLSSPAEINKFGMHLIPKALDFSAYKRIVAIPALWYSYGYTIFRTVLATTITVILTFMGAYPLSKKDMPFAKTITIFIMITMFFSGGLIPNYILVRSLHLMNSIWALVLPGAVNTFLLIVTRNFIMSLPVSLEESAKMDGASEMKILLKIIMPLSMPILATVALYTAVAHWNAWFDGMIYITDKAKRVLQIYLRGVILEGSDPSTDLAGVTEVISTEAVKMATLVVAVIPIICVYPFLQKYFVQGMLVGGVKE